MLAFTRPPPPNLFGLFFGQLPPFIKLHKDHNMLCTMPLFDLIVPLCLIKAFTWNQKTQRDWRNQEITKQIYKVYPWSSEFGAADCFSSSRDLVYMSCTRGSRSATLHTLLRRCYSSLFLEERCSGPHGHFSICYLLTTTYIGAPRRIKGLGSFCCLTFKPLTLLALRNLLNVRILCSGFPARGLPSFRFSF